MWISMAVVSSAIALAYAGISATIWRALRRSGQVRTNRLGLATALIFATCSLGHGYHVVHMLLPTLGFRGAEAAVFRQAVDSHMLVIDVATAVIAVWYWTLRSSYGAVLSRQEHSPLLFEDMRARQRQALTLNDGIVQGLVTAVYALDSQRPDLARTYLDETLVAARTMVGDLVAPMRSGGELLPGDLVREHGATLAQRT